MFGITTTLHGLSPLATYGLGAIFFLGLAILFFLIPAGIVSVELASGCDREGGVYIWVGDAFGTDWGFLATWLQWFQNIVFWTVILTGSAALLAVGMGWDEGANNKHYTAALVLASIWFCTAVTAKGLRSTGRLGWVGSLVGTLLPAILLIGMAAIYLLQGHPSQIPLTPTHLMPDLSQPGNFSFAISTIMIFAGIELMGTRVRDIHNPERTYPRATLLAIGLTVLLLVPTVLAIAIMVPVDELKITAGLVQAVQVAIGSSGVLHWLPLLFAMALLIDALGEIGGWMAGTPISMSAASRDGYLPKALGTRKQDIAPGMLLAQAIAGSVVSVVFIVAPGVESAFWLLSALLVQVYVLMYILLFAAAWQLRRKRPNHPRSFRMPGLTLVCVVGLSAALSVFTVGFFRPSGLTEIPEAHYLLVLCTALLIALGLPLGLIVRKHRLFPNPASIDK